MEAATGTVESFVRVAMPVCAVNSERRVIAWNKAAETLFGFSADRAVGQEWHSVIHTTDTYGCCALCLTERALAAGEVANPIESGLSVDGYHQRVTMLPVPLGFEGDQVIGFMILPADSVSVRVPAPATPIPITSRLRHLPGDRIIERLTPRELDVLECVIEGLDARAIAVRVGITHATARNYVQRILMKLGARNKAEAVNVALRYNLVAS